MEQKPNLALWDRVEKTSPGSTKSAKVNGMQITVIDGYGMIRKATENFGPLGIGWGYEILEERWDDGKPFGVKEEDGSVQTVITKTHTIKLRLWYLLDGIKGEVVQYGHTQAVYRSSYGVSDDGEAPKKSLMDAIKKSLSMLGFSADVFTGQYDDAEYREQLLAEEAIEKAEDKETEIEAKQKELSDYVVGNLEAIKTSKLTNEIKGIVKVTIRHLERQKKIPCLTAIAEKGAKAIARDSESKLRELDQ